MTLTESVLQFVSTDVPENPETFVVSVSMEDRETAVVMTRVDQTLELVSQRPHCVLHISADLENGCDEM